MIINILTYYENKCTKQNGRATRGEKRCKDISFRCPYMLPEREASGY